MRALFICFFAMAMVLLSCGNPPTDRSDLTQEPALLQAQHCIDSAKALLPRLMSIAAATDKAYEFEALKAKNACQIASESLQDLEKLVDSVKNAPKPLPDFQNMKVALQTQTDYMFALMRSANAILDKNSQSFGKWLENPKALPDSIMTPVGRQKKH